MKRRFSLSVIAALLVATSSAMAQVQVRVTAPNVPGGSAVSWDPDGFGGAFYVSPYTGVMTATNQTYIFNCVDFFHHVTLNSPWMATQTYLNAASITATRFDNLQLYLQAAWLTQQYATNPGATSSERNRTIAIQAAIWNIFTPSAPNRVVGSNASNDANDHQWWINRSLENWRGVDASRFFVLTAVGVLPNNTDTRQQEFLVYGPPNVIPPSTTVPEPATLTLLATGLVALGAARRRRKATEGQALNG